MLLANDFVHFLEGLEYHYRWRRYALRFGLMRRRFPEEFSLDEALRAIYETESALAEDDLPEWAAWLVKMAAWRVVPAFIPFGSIL